MISMTNKRRLGTVLAIPLLLFGLPATAETAPSAAAAQPDLVVAMAEYLQREKGVVTVRNLGGADAGASTLLISCYQQTFQPDEDCEGYPGLGEYSTVEFPDARPVKLEPIPAGGAVTVQIPYWRDTTLGISDRTYVFHAVADIGHEVAESDEENNVDNAILYLN